MGVSNLDVLRTTNSIGAGTAKYTTGTTTTTFAANQLTGANFVVYNNTQGTPGSIATRTAVLMLSDAATALTTDGNTTNTSANLVGTNYILRIKNGQGTGTLTVTAGTGVTLTGTATVAINTFRDFLVSFDTATTMTFTSIGTGTDS